MHVQTYFHQNCPFCSRALRIVIELLGRPITCDHCHQRFLAQDHSDNTTQENLEPSLLIVQSNRDQLCQLTRRFAQLGYAVIPVHHPRLALEAASSRDFGVAVVDMTLPEMDGEQLTRKLLRRVNGLQVILLAEPQQELGSNGGATTSPGTWIRIDKPCSLDRLENAVEDAIHESRVARRHTLESSAPPERLVPR